MKLARYVGQGRVEIRDEPPPALPTGGLLVQTKASGLCSGELMDWYMDRKLPHVLGHEVSGIVLESNDSRFPVGSKVAPHHHAACLECEACIAGREVHCERWRSTRLEPGGMAESFAVATDNLKDTHLVEQLTFEDAALMEPLACVAKAIRNARLESGERVAVIGLGSLGLIHMLCLSEFQSVGFEINSERLDWARQQGVTVATEPTPRFDVVFVLPGTEGALRTGFEACTPGGRIVLFAPFAPETQPSLPWGSFYFKEISLIPSYSAGPSDTAQALKWLREGKVKARQVVSHFIGIDELPAAYEAMKRGEILKAMVMFP